MHIKNLKTNKSAISTKANYVLCTGVVMLGIAIGLNMNANSNAEQNTNPTSQEFNINEMTQEEQDDVYAMLYADFKNTQVLGNDGDMITLVKDHKDLAGGLRTSPYEEDISSIAIPTGQYNVTSSTGTKTSFTVTDPDQYFMLDVDYQSGTMEVKEIEKPSHTK